MRTTRIEVEGKPGHTATITRAPGSEHITVELRTPTLARTHHVIAADREDRWSMAEAMQAILDGRPGAGGDIREYAAVLEPFAD
jgi:hypothetical protein